MYGSSEGLGRLVSATDPISGGLIQINLPDAPTVREMVVKGRGSWVVPILLGMVGFWFLSRSRGRRGDW